MKKRTVEYYTLYIVHMAWMGNGDKGKQAVNNFHKVSRRCEIYYVYKTPLSSYIQW